MTVLGQSGRFRLGAQQSPEEEMREQRQTDDRWSKRLSMERKAKECAERDAWIALDRLRFAREKRWGWLLRPARRIKRLFVRAA